MPEITRLFEHKSILESKKGMIAFIQSNKHENPLNTQMLLEVFVFETQVPGSYPRFRRFEINKETASIIMKIWMVKQDTYERITESKFDEIISVIESDILE